MSHTGIEAEQDVNHREFLGQQYYFCVVNPPKIERGYGPATDPKLMSSADDFWSPGLGTERWLMDHRKTWAWEQSPITGHVLLSWMQLESHCVFLSFGNSLFCRPYLPIQIQRRSFLREICICSKLCNHPKIFKNQWFIVEFVQYYPVVYNVYSELSILWGTLGIFF